MLVRVPASHSAHSPARQRESPISDELIGGVHRGQTPVMKRNGSRSIVFGHSPQRVGPPATSVGPFRSRGRPLGPLVPAAAVWLWVGSGPQHVALGDRFRRGTATCCVSGPP